MLEERFLFYSDFNCPFCFALNERFLALGASRNILWRGIEHLPAASSRRPTHLDRAQLENEVGIVRKRAPEVSLRIPDFRPSSRLANALVLHFSRQQDADSDQVSELRTKIYRGYFQAQDDISDAAVLRRYCDGLGLTYPASDSLSAVSAELAEWQADWEGRGFEGRLPAMSTERTSKPLLGFPTYDLLSNYLSGSELAGAPESLVACELNHKQIVLLVGRDVAGRCNTIELEVAYRLETAVSVAAAEAWLRKKGECPDMILIDHNTTGPEGLEFCSRMRTNPACRDTVVIVLLAMHDRDLELAAFDSGATDVVFDLGDAKICQARLDLLLRLKRSTSLLAATARSDYLTGLPNRREFDRKIDDEWRRGQRTAEELSLIVVDVDKFKNYNDNYGHSTGDDCLRMVALAMAECLKRPSDILTRYGGEEFVAVLPNTSGEGAQALAEDMCKAVRALQIPHAYSPVANHVTVSAGVAAMVPSGGNSPRELIECADNALYCAKATGRDRVVEFSNLGALPSSASLAQTGTFAIG